MLAVLLLSVVSSGIPMVKVHSHENATFGHTHDAHDRLHDHDVAREHGADEPTDSEDGDADTPCCPHCGSSRTKLLAQWPRFGVP